MISDHVFFRVGVLSNCKSSITSWVWYKYIKTNFLWDNLVVLISHHFVDLCRRPNGYPLTHKDAQNCPDIIQQFNNYNWLQKGEDEKINTKKTSQARYFWAMAMVILISSDAYGFWAMAMVFHISGRWLRFFTFLGDGYGFSHFWAMAMVILPAATLWFTWVDRPCSAPHRRHRRHHHCHQQNQRHNDFIVAFAMRLQEPTKIHSY